MARNRRKVVVLPAPSGPTRPFTVDVVVAVCHSGHLEVTRTGEFANEIAALGRVIAIVNNGGNLTDVEAIDRSRTLLAIVVPENYSKDLLAGRGAQVQLIIDGSDSNTASIAVGYTEALVQSYALQLRSEAQVQKGGGKIEQRCRTAHPRLAR